MTKRPERNTRTLQTLGVLLLLAALIVQPLAAPPLRAQDQPDAQPPVFLPAISSGGAQAPVGAASHTPDPATVTLVGSLQSEIGCGGDWDPGCAASHLAYDAEDAAWQGTWPLPAGDYEYKAALNGGWDENYGANAAPGGANIPIAGGGSVKFYYDHESHWITDNRNTRIVTVPGSFQSEIGCGGDWDPGCLRSWLIDADGDGVATRSVRIDAPGSYEAKAAIGESWDENYGQGGAPNGANLTFAVTTPSTVTFSFAHAGNLLTITVTPLGDDIEWDGLGHDSHSDLYRVPFGAVTPGATVLLRFRTFAGDVDSVRARIWDSSANAQSFLTLEKVAADVSCYDPALVARACDFWQAALTPAQKTILYYRFVIVDGTKTVYYADDPMRDGGWGRPSDTAIDDGYVITVYDPAFRPVEWMQDAVVYQIFPDRFRDGRSNNTPSTSEPRYGFPTNPLDRILVKPWSALPEGYCRHYEQPAQPCTEEPRGRDYFGGDLRGVQQRLNYLQALGVTAIYFNPIFEAASNHAYDTQDYFQIDHFFGSNEEFQQLAREAQKRGIRIILDGVFNHVSSDSPYFDRYGHFAAVGACESASSPYRSWFTFRPATGAEVPTCMDANGQKTLTYDAWFGFDSLPVLNKNNPQVQALFNGASGVGQYWLRMGAAGWRLDVMGDGSFPDSFWRDFRTTVKATDPNAVIIGELWKKFEVLPKSLGDMADSTMNYRFRNAILGYFGTVDFKGFPDDGQSFQPPTTFANKMISVREDSPDALYSTMLNIMDSHDTQRILWSLTPGLRNREQREFNAANVAAGKQMLRLAAVVQMTTPGAPTIYYGDEVGVTGEDDPDDRRTFPWTGGGQFGAGGDASLLAHYQKLTALRAANPVLRDGSLRFLLLDDAASTMAYLMRTPDAAAIVAINRNSSARTLTIPLQGALPQAVALQDRLGGLGTVTASGGTLTLTLPPASAAILFPTPGQDLVAPPAPAALAAQSGDRVVALSWQPVAGAAQYAVYRSPVTGGGYVEIGRTPGTTFEDTGVQNAVRFYYVVRALDAAGNLGAASNEASALPRYTIGWANLQWPPTLDHTISALDRTAGLYGQVWIDGVTNAPGATPTLRAQAGYGPAGSNPATSAGWTWVDASFNTDAGNNDEFVASFLPEQVGLFDYLFRYSTTNGAEWLYADLNGPVAAGAQPANPGKLTVGASADTTPPAMPQNLRVVGGSPAGIELAWDAVAGDATLYGYEVLRSTAQGGPFALLGRVTATGYTDTAVEEGAIYWYLVRALDTSFNRSGEAGPVQGAAARRLVTIQFNVTVPATTDATGRVPNIAGTLNRLEGGLPEWNPGGSPLARADATHWAITLSGYEGTQIEYKYALASWDYVEKDAACAEVANRTLTLSYGATGTQTVNDTVANWRNVAPCGN